MLSSTAPNLNWKDQSVPRPVYTLSLTLAVNLAVTLAVTLALTLTLTLTLGVV